MKYAYIISLIVFGYFTSSGQTCLDSTFAENGIKNYLDKSIKSGAPFIQNDASILTLCTDIELKKFYWRKLLPNGENDFSFGSDGMYEYPLEGFISSSYYKCPDSSLILRITKTEDNPAKFLKLKRDLSIDSAYGVNGIARTKKLEDSAGIKVWKDWWSFDINEAAIQADGKMLIANAYYWGSSVTLMRFTSDGQMDTTFNHTGYRTYHCGEYPKITGLGTTADGNIILSGMSYDSSGVMKILMMSFLPDGRIDSAFNHTGILHTDLGLPGYPYMKNQAILESGKILLTGVKAGPFIAQFNPDATLDTAFNDGLGYLILPGQFTPMLLAVQNRKIVIGGSVGEISKSHTGIVRILPVGSIDSSFCNKGIFEYKPEIYRYTAVSYWDLSANFIIIGGGVAMPFDHPIEGYGQLLKINNPHDESESDDICGVLYPNPTTKGISIKDAEIQGGYTIYDNLGRVVSAGMLTPDRNIDINMLPDAVYYVIVQSKGKSQCKYKFIKL